MTNILGNLPKDSKDLALSQTKNNAALFATQRFTFAKKKRRTYQRLVFKNPESNSSFVILFQRYSAAKPQQDSTAKALLVLSVLD